MYFVSAYLLHAMTEGGSFFSHPDPEGQQAMLAGTVVIDTIQWCGTVQNKQHSN